jgi:hypothetical protein
VSSYGSIYKRESVICFWAFEFASITSDEQTLKCNMTGDTKSLKAQVLLGLLAAATLAVMVYWVFPHDARPALTYLEWRAFSQWKFSLKRVAYCSERAAAFRGWQADFGPLAVLHLKPTLKARASIQPADPANRKQLFRPE